MCIWERFTLWSHHSPIHNGFCRVCKQDTLLVCIHLQVFAESKSLIHCHLHLSDVKRFCLDSHRKRFRHLISFPFPLLKKTFFFSTRPLIPHRHQSDWFCVYHSFILKTRDFSSHSFCSCVIYLTNSFLLHEKWLYWALTKKKKIAKAIPRYLVLSRLHFEFEYKLKGIWNVISEFANWYYKKISAGCLPYNNREVVQCIHLL